MRQRAASTRNAEVGTRNIMTGPVRWSAPRRSIFPCCSAFRVPPSAFVSSPHRSISSEPPGPRDPVRGDPDAQPHDLSREALHHGPAVHGTRQEVHGKRQHVGKPEEPRHLRDGGREQGEWREPSGEKQRDTGVQLHDGGGACGPEREQPRGETDKEPQRGGKEHGHGGGGPPARPPTPPPPRAPPRRRPPHPPGPTR